MRAVKEVRDKMGGQVTAATLPENVSGKITHYPAQMRQFLHEVRLEMRNVTWPSWNDVQSTTLVVLVATFFFGFYLGMALDVPLARLMTWLLKVGKELLR